MCPNLPLAWGNTKKINVFCRWSGSGVQWVLKKEMWNYIQIFGHCTVFLHIPFIYNELDLWKENCWPKHKCCVMVSLLPAPLKESTFLHSKRRIQTSVTIFLKSPCTLERRMNINTQFAWETFVAINIQFRINSLTIHLFVIASLIKVLNWGNKYIMILNMYAFWSLSST